MENEKTREFLDQVRECLSNMPQRQKDYWIMTQAMLESEDRQESFIKSLRGDFDNRYVPDDKDIDNFCEGVNEGDIFFEYNTWYEEFDSFGDYKDDWEVEYLDPHGITEYLDRIFSGCHDLIKIGSYCHAAKILEKVCRLEFDIEEYEDTEDFDPEANPFSLADVYRNHLLDTDKNQVAGDLIFAHYMGYKDYRKDSIVKEMVNLLLLPVCEDLMPGDVLKDEADKDFFRSLSGVIEEKLSEIEKSKKEDTSLCSSDIDELEKQQKQLRKKLKHLQLLLEREENPEEEGEKQLTRAWSDIQGLLTELRYEPYIDDQWQISEIWEICEKLVKEHKCQYAPWELRKKILADIVENDYYDYYGCIDPMEDLVKELRTGEQEYLEFADMLCRANRGACTREAAMLYREHGEEEKYVNYLWDNLGKQNREYIELMDFYEKIEDWADVITVGEIALSKCKEDMTDIFIGLMCAARKQGDTLSVQNYFSVAKKRKKVQRQKVEDFYNSLTLD